MGTSTTPKTPKVEGTTGHARPNAHPLLPLSVTPPPFQPASLSASLLALSTIAGAYPAVTGASLLGEDEFERAEIRM